MKNGGLHQVEDEECVADRLFGRVHPDDVVPHARSDTLSEKDDFRLKERDRRPIPYPWGSLTTEGINKAQSAPLYRYTKRGSAAQKTLAKTFDDAEMRPKKLTSANAFADAVNRIVLDARKKKMGPRGTNPLDPTYKLPTFVKETPPVPRFIKDNLDTSDIKGECSAQRVTRGRRRT